MTELDQPERAPKKAQFEIPDGLRQQLAKYAADLTAQVAQSEVFAAATRAALEPLRQQMQELAVRITADVAPMRAQLLRQLEWQTYDDAGLVDSVTVVVNPATHMTTTSFSPPSADDDGLGEDTYRLLGAISLQLEDVAAGRPATAMEIYNAITNTIVMLVALIALLGPMI